MSDFHQSGPVTALPRLLTRPVEELESEILALTPKFPVSLVIPMVPAELDRPALAGILAELSNVEYLHSLVVSLNRATPRDYERTRRFFASFPGKLVIVWSEAPPIKQFLHGLEKAGLFVGQPGKGRACWLAMGYLLCEEKVDYIAFMDADILNFGREMLARLILPALDPIVDFDFVKAYYSRFSDRLHGRVTRLYLSPLLAAFARLIGQDPYIRYLSSFRYALAAINGLTYDRHQEELNVHTFVGALRRAIQEFHRDPLGPPLVPNWARVWAGVPESGPQLLASVG